MIIVYGATGATGTRVCKELVARRAELVIAGRSRDRLDALAAELGGVPVRVAAADDPAALAAAFAGATVVASCAGPFGRIGESVVAAAITARCHYVDTAGEQGFLRDAYERYESAARKRDVAVVSGVAFEIAIGDWAAAWAAEMIAGPAAPGERVAGGDPLDELSIAYAVDDISLASPPDGSLRSPGWVWERDQWDPSPLAAEQRTINFGPELGGERPAFSFPSGEVITVPRHVDARRIQTYLSIARSRWLGVIARAASRLAPVLHRAGAGALVEQALVAATNTGDTTTGTRFAVVARARRRFAVAQVRILGGDPYALTAAVVADAVVDLAANGPRATGARTPAELWPAEPSLRALADHAGLAIEAA